MALPVSTKPWSQIYCTVAPTGNLGLDMRRRLCSTSPGSWQEVTMGRGSWEGSSSSRAQQKPVHPGLVPGSQHLHARKLYPLVLYHYHFAAVSLHLSRSNPIHASQQILIGHLPGTKYLEYLVDNPMERYCLISQMRKLRQWEVKELQGYQLIMAGIWFIVHERGL